MIDKLRQQMLQQREQDGLEISRLTQQLSLTAGTTLSKLQALVQSNQVQAPGYGGGMSRYDRMTREELSQRITEMDSAMQQQAAEIKALNRNIEVLKDKNLNFQDKISDLENELEVERRQVELRQKMQEIDKFKRDLKAKQELNDKLVKTISELNERMQKYESERFDSNEDKKMGKISEDMKMKESREEIRKLKDKISMIESSRSVISKDLKESNVKV